MGFRVDSDFDGGWILIFCYGFFFFFLDLGGWVFCYGFLFFGFGWLDFLLWIFVFWTLDSNEAWV